MAARADPLPFSDREDGISCPYFDVFLRIGFSSGKPVGLDADGKINGPRPYATERIDAGDTQRVRRLDLTALVDAWWDGKLPNDGLLLRVTAGDQAKFYSREYADTSLRPQLLLTLADGSRRYLEPAADAVLDCSTYKGLGQLPTLLLHGGNWGAMRFDLGPAKAAFASRPKSAQLIMVRTADARPALLQLEVLALQAPYRRLDPAKDPGLAQRYPRDQGIDRDPDVLFADGFEGRNVDERWKQGMRAPSSIVAHDAANGFVPLTGRALRILIPKGQQVGLDLRYRFKDQQGAEPEEMYFRYALRLARSWLGTGDGGKLPGLAGTYGQAGWGGRPWDGAKGWSLRGAHGLAAPVGHLAAGQLMLGSYAYHSQSGAAYGEVFPWSGSGWGGLVQPDRWYSIEQRVRLNTPGREDGVLEAWVDGQLVLSRAGLRLRDKSEIKIEEVWMNFFHGGTAVAPQDMHAFIDHVVVARRYIGPVKY